MAHAKSAKKRIRQTVKRTDINNSRKNRIRTFVKKVETAIAKGDMNMATSALKEAQPEIHRGVSHGLLHRNNAARKISRLTKRVKALQS